MFKMMSKIAGAGAVAALLLTAQPLEAQCCPPTDTCCPDWCDMCGSWEIGVHALYFTPVACEYDFATLSAVPGGGTFPVAGAKCKLDWGFRVFGKYMSDCSFFGLSYQWFESKSNKTAEGLNFVRNMPADFTAQRAEAALRFEYQNLDISVGKYLHRSCGCNFFVFGNARWIDLSFSRAVRGIDANGLVLNSHEKSTLEGGALGVGLGTEMDLWCDIGLFGSANLLGVIAERSTRQVFAPTGTGATTQSPLGVANIKYASDTCINPEANFRIGLNYNYQCGCWNFVGEIGYEVDYFWNAFSFPRGNPNAAVERFRTCEDVGFSGLFFGGRFLF